MEKPFPEAFCEVYPSESNEKTVKDCEQVAALMSRLNLFLILSAQLPENKQRQTQFSVASAALISACVTLTSIIEITRNLSLRVKDATILARVFYETCLIGTFVCCDDGKRARRAESYAVYKAFSSQKRFRKFGMSKVLFVADRGIGKALPRLQEAISELTKANGKIDKSCFAETREEMIGLIADKIPHAGVYLSGVEGMIYEISSEFAHGSFFGFLESPSISANQEMEQFEYHAELIRFSVVLSSSSVALAVSHLVENNAISMEITSLADKLLREIAAEQQDV